MTDDLVEQIKADRALALVGVPPMSHFVSVAARERVVIDWTRAKERRIARLDDLEDAYLAAHTRIEAQAALILDLAELVEDCLEDGGEFSTEWDIKARDSLASAKELSI